MSPIRRHVGSDPTASAVLAEGRCCLVARTAKLAGLLGPAASPGPSPASGGGLRRRPAPGGAVVIVKNVVSLLKQCCRHIVRKMMYLKYEYLVIIYNIVALLHILYISS